MEEREASQEATIIIMTNEGGVKLKMPFDEWMKATEALLKALANIE
jgi:hypothetical protein